MDIIRGLITVILVFIGFVMVLNTIPIEHWSMLFKGVAVALAVTWVAFKLLQELSQKYTDHQKTRYPELTGQEQQADYPNGAGHHVAKTTY